MPPPPTARAYQKNAGTIAKHVKVVAKDGMISAAKEIRDAQHANEDDVVNCGVSCDGTWQKRGHSSQNGCVIIMSIVVKSWMWNYSLKFVNNVNFTPI